MESWVGPEWSRNVEGPDSGVGCMDAINLTAATESRFRMESGSFDEKEPANR